MVFIDVIVLIFLCWFGFKGFKNGLIYEIASILALILGCWAANRFSDGIALMITDSVLAKPIAFVLIFVVVLLLVHFAGILTSKIVKLVIPDIIDHIFGLLFGVCKVLVVFSVIFYTFQMLDKREILFKKELKEKSIAFQYIEPIVPHAMHWHEQLSETP